MENAVTKEYLNETDQRHYVISLTSPEEVTQLKTQVSNFNRGSNKQQRAFNTERGKVLRISHIPNSYYGNNKKQVAIIIRYFNNLPAAKSYAVLLNKEIGATSQFLPIAQQNYRTFLRNKDFTSYRNYYEKVLK